ncbi:invasion protein, partial [Shigella flexneri]|nr:invasion protein [Shigella flexneri]EHF0707039.1 invasion protein [Shigella flexneri]
TWELILDGYSESSYSATPRFAAARLPWFRHFIIKITLNGRNQT